MRHEEQTAKNSAARPTRGNAWLGWAACLLLMMAGCDNSSSSGGPLGPIGPVAAPLVTVTPATITLAKGDTFTFAATGGKGPFTWSLSNPTLATIVAATGVFTAGNQTGTLTVTATDSKNATGTASVTISNKKLIISPTTAKVGKGGSLTFIVTGATAPVFWSVSDSSIGSIAVGTGVFTAGIIAGTATVSVLDADGDTATASVQVINNTISVSPASISFSSIPVAAPVFTANGGSGSFTFLVTGFSNGYKGAAISASPPPTATSVTIAITAMPTGDKTGPPLVTGEGTQTLTITATDSNGDFGTALLTLVAPPPKP
ncbi:MAG: hypothetical protein ACE5GQ_03870 [Nitrospinales bacterium]